MDRKMIAILDKMTGEEVYKYVTKLTDEWELEAVDDFRNNYFHTLDSKRRVDFINANTRKLVGEAQEKDKIILVHKRELVRLRKAEVLVFYHSVLLLLVSHSTPNWVGTGTGKQPKDIALLYSLWELNSFCTWDQIIDTVRDLLTELDQNAMGKYRKYFESVIKITELMKEKESEYDYILNYDTKPDNPADQKMKFDKKEMKELVEWFKQPSI